MPLTYLCVYIDVYCAVGVAGAHTFVQPPKSKRSLRFGGVDERLLPVYGQVHRRVETQSSEAGGSSEFDDDIAVVVDTDNPDLMEKQLHYSPQGALLAKGKQQGPGRGRRAAEGGARGLTSSGSMATSSQSGSPRGGRNGRGGAGSRGPGDSFLGRPPRKDTRGGQSGRVGGEGREGTAPRRGRSALRSRASGSEADDRRVAVRMRCALEGGRKRCGFSDWSEPFPCVHRYSVR